MSLTPLHTARLVLTTLAEGDVDAMLPVLAAPELYAFTGGTPPTRDELASRYARWVAGSPNPDERWLNWIVRAQGSGEAIGTVQATVRSGTALLAWIVGTQHQGRGVATEAASKVAEALLTDAAFGVTRIEAHIHPKHESSRAVAHKLGLRATSREHEGETVWARGPLRALITGTSRGLGLALTRALVARGYHVVATTRDATPSAEWLAAVTGASAPTAVAHATLELSSETSLASFCAGQLARGVPFDLLVHNAGVYPRAIDASIARETMNVNFRAPLAITTKLVPLLHARSHVLFVSSMLGDLSAFAPALRARFASPQLTRAELLTLADEFEQAVAAVRHVPDGWPWSAYDVSKAAIDAAARVLARELSPLGIRVNSACPGWVQTDMGGRGAPRTLAQGTATLLAAATRTDDVSGTFFPS